MFLVNFLTDILDQTFPFETASNKIIMISWQVKKNNLRLYTKLNYTSTPVD